MRGDPARNGEHAGLPRQQRAVRPVDGPGRAEAVARSVIGLQGVPVRLDALDRSPDRPRAGSEAELVADLRAEWRKHRDNPATGRCPLCGVPSCLRWRYANSLLRMCGDDPEGDQR